MKIKNQEAICGHGDTDSRRIVVDVTERTLEKLDSFTRISELCSYQEGILTIGKRSWDLNQKHHIYLVGAGKAANHMARAVASVLGDRLTAGIVIVKILEEEDRRYPKVRFVEGGHPIPNAAGMKASQEILDMVDNSGSEDLFIGVISGGSSALMSLPITGITLEEEQAATDVLLKSGAGIYEINAVRRHISQMNGGRLAQRIQDVGAEFIGFGISDAVGKPPTKDIGIPDPHYTSTPIGPDATTLEDARGCITNHRLEDKLPKSVVDFIFSADERYETPKEFPDNTYFLVNTLPDGAAAALEAATDLGIPATILTTFLEGEARDAGRFMAALAREVQTYGNPFTTPRLFISSGEVTTKIGSADRIEGHGGPGQEMVTGFALASSGCALGAVLLSIDSEGTDGTADVAGGITDSQTSAAASRAGISLYEALDSHSCYEALSMLSDTVITGNTGTNLCDLNILYVP